MRRWPCWREINILLFIINPNKMTTTEKSQNELFAAGEVETIKKSQNNPLIRVYGKGPDGTKCGSCVLHYFKQASRYYPKCLLRKETGGAASDHSSRFPSCGKYQPKK